MFSWMCNRCSVASLPWFILLKNLFFQSFFSSSVNIVALSVALSLILSSALSFNHSTHSLQTNTRTFTALGRRCFWHFGWLRNYFCFSILNRNRAFNCFWFSRPPFFSALSSRDKICRLFCLPYKLAIHSLQWHPPHTHTHTDVFIVW